MLGNWQMARALLVAERQQQDPQFSAAKIATARFYAEAAAAGTGALSAAVCQTGGTIASMPVELF